MNLVAAAVGGVVSKLTKLLEDEFKLQRELKMRIQSLSNELNYIHAFLCKVSEVPWEHLDEQVKVWASDIREASYDMEDVLDIFLVHVNGRKPSGQNRLQRAMNRITNVFNFSKGKARHEVGSAIQDIMKRLQEVADLRARYKIDDLLVNTSATTSSFDPRLKAMYKEVESLVGTDGPSKEIISKLSFGQRDDMTGRKKIVSIVGIGGLGKTTLAKAVYDKLRTDFECCAFVPVGQNPNLQKLLMDILYELDKNKLADIDAKNRNERQLIDSIREFLVNRRYLIVIDDIWENTYWKERMELALLENNCGSRIIITTRNFEVATKIADEVYRMKPLSNDDSKKLFYTRIFGAQDKILDIEQISNKFLKKCDGVPLAIITMASLLAGKPRDKWSDMFTSVGFGHKDDQQVDNTMKILSFSYYDMPAHLRTCLLYLSVFPEDSRIHKEPLIHKWIAEGFIQGKKGIWLYELGEQYFNDLVNRSMIQAVDKGSSSMVQYCYVHDMVLDLIRSISYKENFVTVIDRDEAPPSSARRIAFHKNTMHPTAHGNMMDMTQVRSLIAVGCDVGNQDLLSSFKVLRVLEMTECSSLTVSHLVHLKNLPHLRYLGFKEAFMHSLQKEKRRQVMHIPNEIGALKLLQTLNLMRIGTIHLTPRISQLTQLVCLRIDSFLATEPNWIGRLKSLEDLELKITGGINFLIALGSLRELKVLRIHFWKEINNSMQKDFVLPLRNLHKLVDLQIKIRYTSHADTSIWGEPGFVLPRHLRSLDMGCLVFPCLPSCISAACLPNLTDLALCVDAMEQKDMEFLGLLPELCYLCLYTGHTVTQIDINPSTGYFQKLRSCYMPYSMIQFRCKEGDSSVSFHISDGTGAMRFGSSNNYFSIPRHFVMPNLENISFLIFSEALNDGKGICGTIGLEYLPSLQKVEVDIECFNASAAEVNEVEAGLRKATEVHPNHPTLVTKRLNAHLMISAIEDHKLGDDNLPAEEDGQKQEEPSDIEGVIESSIDSV